MPRDLTVRPVSLITYDGLPISSGGAHRLRGRDIRLAWRSIQTFLTQLTDYERPDGLRLVLYDDNRMDIAYHERALEFANKAFGSGARRLKVLGDQYRMHETVWNLHTAQFDEALSLVETLGPGRGGFTGGSLVLELVTGFHLADPETGRVFAGQGRQEYGGQEVETDLFLGESSLRLFLGKPIACGLFLSLPFPEVTDELRAYVSLIDENLPFRLSPHHWARWQLNGAGTGYYKRVIPPPQLPTEHGARAQESK